MDPETPQCAGVDVRGAGETGGLVLIWFIAVMTANILALNFGLSVYLVVKAMFEQHKLLSEYGEAYADADPVFLTPEPE